MHEHSHAYQTVSQLEQKNKQTLQQNHYCMFYVSLQKKKNHFIKDGLLELYVDGRVYTDYTVSFK